MKILFYFKVVDVYSPSMSGHGGGGGNQKEMDPNQNVLIFNILCIEQIDPNIRLQSLLRNKKLPHEITKFV